MMINCWKQDKFVWNSFIIVPLAVILLFGYLFGGLYIEQIPIAVADLDQTSFSRKVTEAFGQHPGFQLVQYVSTEAELTEAVASKSVSGGLLIPSGFSEMSQKGKSAKALMIIDGTNMLVGNTMQGYAQTVMGTISTGVQMEILTGSGVPAPRAEALMGGFRYEERLLYEPTMSYLYYLVYLIVPYLIQMFYVCFFALPLFIEEREQGTLLKLRSKKRYGRMFSLWILGTLSTFVAFQIASLVFRLPVTRDFLSHSLLFLGFFFALTGEAFVLSFIFNSRNKIYFNQAYAILSSLLIFTSGAVWPDYMMPKPVTTVMSVIWPYLHMAVPFKSLYLKDFGLVGALPAFGKLLIFGVVWLVIGILFILHQRKNMEKK